ncbi:MAG: Kdo hydroxylase family protein [Burkholderiales bacterium]
MTEILTLDIDRWQPDLAPGAQASAVRALEGGGVVVLPRLRFALGDDELRFLSPRWSDGRAKNISVERKPSARSGDPRSRLRHAAVAMVSAFLVASPDPATGDEAHRIQRRGAAPVMRAVRAGALPPEATGSAEVVPTGARGRVAEPAPDVVLKGARGAADELDALAAMINRFAEDASTFVRTLFPRYAPYVKRARTSYRPQPAVGRDVSWRKDDSRLHVDAFPSRPTGGERILRVFHNLNPREDRVWRVGEDFETMARTLLPRVRPQRPGEAAALAMLFVTKSRRSAYDHLMLGLHDQAKADLAYQRDCAQQVVRFAPGTTWICFSDQVMHAAVSGQYMLEQTIHLPVSALYDRGRAPLAILERIAGHPLVPENAAASPA